MSYYLDSFEKDIRNFGTREALRKLFEAIENTDFLESSSTSEDIIITDKESEDVTSSEESRETTEGFLYREEEDF